MSRVARSLIDLIPFSALSTFCRHDTPSCFYSCCKTHANHRRNTWKKGVDSRIAARRTPTAWPVRQTGREGTPHPSAVCSCSLPCRAANAHILYPSRYTCPHLDPDPSLPFASTQPFNLYSYIYIYIYMEGGWKPLSNHHHHPNHTLPIAVPWSSSLLPPNICDAMYEGHNICRCPVCCECSGRGVPTRNRVWT